jgi:phage tail-like protein
MPDKAAETVKYPFIAFNFSVEIDVPGIAPEICSAAFSECDGLEMTMEVKTIREGGNNGKQIRLTGPMNYGQLTLKRGMTETFHLWRWAEAMLSDPGLRADAYVRLLGPELTDKGEHGERVRFRLSRCVPVKLKAPAMNAKDGTVAIEELQLAYESLTLESQ